MAGTKEGKAIIKEIVKEVKADLQHDEFNEAMNEIDSYGEDNSRDSEDVEGFDFEELMGLKGGSDSVGHSDGSNDEESDDEDGFQFGELF